MADNNIDVSRLEIFSGDLSSSYLIMDSESEIGKVTPKQVYSPIIDSMAEAWGSSLIKVVDIGHDTPKWTNSYSPSSRWIKYTAPKKYMDAGYKIAFCYYKKIGSSLSKYAERIITPVSYFPTITINSDAQYVQIYYNVVKHAENEDSSTVSAWDDFWPIVVFVKDGLK